MPNQTYAIEWLEIAKRNLETAEFLLKHDHYTHIIGIEIHQTIEKTLKSISHTMELKFLKHMI